MLPRSVCCAPSRSSGQDQVAIIKRQLQHVLPGVQIFLDVDDLTDTSKLDEFVSGAQCMLLFLSRHYFFSRACLIEIDCTLSMRKPIVSVHEREMNRGGEPLEVLRTDCESKGRDAEAIFDHQPIIPWHRVADFQQLSLVLIAERLLAACPEYTNVRTQPRLYVRGEVRRQLLTFSQPVRLYASPHNFGAQAMAQELVDREGAIAGAPKGLSLAETGLKPPVPTLAMMAASKSRPVSFDRGVAIGPSGQRAEPHPKNLAGGASGNSAARRLHWRVNRSSHANDPTETQLPATAMLVYLNAKTFDGKSGELFANEIRAAHKSMTPLLLVHENDLGRHGCEFALFFQTTPQDLMDAGLYRKIANAAHEPPHREVSIALILKALGAKVVVTKLGGAALMFQREMSEALSSPGSAKHLGAYGCSRAYLPSFRTREPKGAKGVQAEGAGAESASSEPSSVAPVPAVVTAKAAPPPPTPPPAASDVPSTMGPAQVAATATAPTPTPAAAPTAAPELEPEPLPADAVAAPSAVAVELPEANEAAGPHAQMPSPGSAHEIWL